MFSAVSISDTVDIAFFSVLLIACIAGTVRGASGEIARLLALVGGVAALVFTKRFLGESFALNEMFAFSVALLAAIIVVLLVNHLARKIIRVLLGQPADAIAGAVMALISAFLILAVLVCGITIFVPQDWYEKALSDTYAERLVSPLVARINGIFVTQ